MERKTAKMNKKILCFALALILLIPLASCGKSNEYSLVYIPDGTDGIYYIYYNEERVVYVIGGVVSAEIDSEIITLDKALADEKLTVDAIIASAEKDEESGKLEVLYSTDSGTKEFIYPTFNLIVLDDKGCMDVYFAPKDIHSYDLNN